MRAKIREQHVNFASLTPDPAFNGFSANLNKACYLN